MYSRPHAKPTANTLFVLEAYILVYQFSHTVCMRMQSNRIAKFSNLPTHTHIYITRKECGDTVANYESNKAVVDNTRNKDIIYRTFRLPMGSLLQRFSTIYNEFQNYSSENELLNHACFHFVL